MSLIGYLLCKYEFHNWKKTSFRTRECKRCKVSERLLSSGFDGISIQENWDRDLDQNKN